MGELTKRVLTAIVAIPLVLFFLWKGGIYLLSLIAVITFLGIREFVELGKDMGASFFYLPLAVITVLSIVLGWLYHKDLVFIFGGFFLIMLISLFSGKNRFLTLSLSSFVFFYFFIAMIHVLMLREREGGFNYLIYVLAATFLSDTGAYFAGKAFGKHRVAPEISPGKSWEGVVGGIVLSYAGMILGTLILTGKAVLYWTLPYAFLITLCGLTGDLAESSFKRAAGKKDSGYFFPGHGGVLDRLDSLMVNIPVSYYFFYYLKGF